MANFRENIYNDGKGKQQSCEYRIEITENAPWYYNGFSSVTGYGENEEEAKRECLTYLKIMLNDLMNFIEEIDNKEER
jgi:hypothetical protein